MSTERPLLSDKELWQRLAMDRPAAPATVSDMDFAAWLEGRLPETMAASIEAAVAADPALREAALELADILGKPLPAPPPRLAVRAQALVGFAAEQQASRISWWAGLLPDFGQGFGFQRGALAGIAVVVAAVGFLMGGGLGESYAEGKYASLQSTTDTRPFGRDTINDLTDLFSDNT
ncbi:MAG TPA: hypothetical protein VLA02_10930 [Reyranella sp.]|nr:hypothetical protein [Reyranella sp.]